MHFKLVEYLITVKNLGKLFFHSVSKLYLVALKESACCSTVSRTIFQKQSATAILKLRVVNCDDIPIDSLHKIDKYCVKQVIINKLRELSFT